MKLNKMSTKHTQGNWEVSKHGNNDSFGVHAEGCANDLAIVIGGNEQGGEAEANAKLIAAAPDMLEALQACMDSFDYMGGLNHAASRHARKLANAAINKATN